MDQVLIGGTLFGIQPGAIWTIMRLTIRETSRRKLLLALLGLTAVVIGMTLYGVSRLQSFATDQQLSLVEVRTVVSQLLILVMFMFSFVLALSASAIASPSVSSEIESGVLMTIVTRPVRRAEVLLGKWLGLAALLAGYAAGVCALEFVVVELASGFVPPSPVLAAAYLFGEGALLLSLSLLLSTQVPAIAAGVIGVAVFGAGWLAGVVGTLGSTLNISALRTIGEIGRFALPTDGLWHAAIYYLESPSLLTERLSDGRQGNPFLAQGAPAWPYLVWVLCWFLIVMGAAVASFERREL
jgi:ABC-type transport system involved in multi-copper enzyme maturation permease subunit